MRHGELFNAPALVKAAESREELAALANRGYREGAESLRVVGEALLKAKGMCRHGTWLPWLKANIEFSRFHAARIMRAARANRGPEGVIDALTQPADDGEPETPNVTSGHICPDGDGPDDGYQNSAQEQGCGDEDDPDAPIENHGPAPGIEVPPEDGTVDPKWAAEAVDQSRKALVSDLSRLIHALQKARDGIGSLERKNVKVDGGVLTPLIEELALVRASVRTLEEGRGRK